MEVSIFQEYLYLVFHGMKTRISDSQSLLYKKITWRIVWNRSEGQLNCSDPYVSSLLHFLSANPEPGNINSIGIADKNTCTEL